MASSINASTAGAGGVITTADASGILNLQSGGVTVATINSTGIVMASNTAPAFSAYQSSAQTIAAAFAKMQFQSETFDTNNNFDSTTNYRFTPTIAGYYFVTAQIWANNGAISVQPAIYKNGSVNQYGAYLTQTSQISGLIYMNGSTDYLEIYGYLSSSNALSTGAERNFFQGFLARSA